MRVHFGFVIVPLLFGQSLDRNLQAILGLIWIDFKLDPGGLETLILFGNSHGRWLFRERHARVNPTWRRNENAIFTDSSPISLLECTKHERAIRLNRAAWVAAHAIDRLKLHPTAWHGTAVAERHLASDGQQLGPSTTAEAHDESACDSCDKHRREDATPSSNWWCPRRTC